MMRYESQPLDGSQAPESIPDRTSHPKRFDLACILLYVPDALPPTVRRLRETPEAASAACEKATACGPRLACHACAGPRDWPDLIELSES